MSTNVAAERRLSERLPGINGNVWLALGLTVATLAALALRTGGRAQSGFWRDEAELLWIVKLPTFADMIRFLQLHESHPPLYYIMTRFWIQLAGGSDAAMVALPIFFGVLTVPVLGLVGRNVFSSRTGMAAAILFAVAPIAVRTSVYVRPYSFLPLMCLVSTYLLSLGLRGHRGMGVWLGYAAATLAMLLTHHWSWLVWGGQCSVALVWLAAGDRLGLPRLGIKTVVRGLGAQVVVLAGYAFWVPSLLYQVSHAGYDPEKASFYGFLQKASDLTTMNAEGIYTVLLATALFVAFFCRRFYLGWPVEPGASGDASNERIGFMVFGGVPVAALAAALVLSRRSNLLVPHTMTAIGPCLLLCTIEVLATFSPRRPRLVLAVFTGLLVIQAVRKDLGQGVVGGIKSNAREAAAVVAREAGPDDLILVLPQWDASSFYYYYGSFDRGLHYPMADFKGPIYYDDAKKRLLDPFLAEALAHRLEIARNERKKVWLVDEIAENPPDVPRGLEINSVAGPGTYTNIGVCRTIQFRRMLVELFGAPRQVDVPYQDRGAGLDAEILHVGVFGEKASVPPRLK